MIILTKKNILYVVGITTMFIFAYFFTIITTININKEKLNAVETVSLPVNNKVIVIDAGHGVPDERCRK